MPNRLPHLKRVVSDGEVDAMSNKNVNWIGPRFFVFYAVIMVVYEFIVRVALVETLHILTKAQGWTLVHATHGVINFVVMHYVTGTPGELQDQGEYSNLTWWEQLDDGTHWTTARKALMLIPIVLFLVTSHLTDYEIYHLAMNLAVLALVMIPKLPQLHRVRLVSVDEDEE
jgi:heme-degrading monooxygenase HmoA